MSRLRYFVRSLTSESLPLRSVAFRAVNDILALHKTRQPKRPLRVLTEAPYLAFCTPGEPVEALPSNGAEVVGPRPSNAAHSYHSSADQRPFPSLPDSSVMFVDKNFMAWNAWPREVCL